MHQKKIHLILIGQIHLKIKGRLKALHRQFRDLTLSLLPLPGCMAGHSAFVSHADADDISSVYRRFIQIGGQQGIAVMGSVIIAKTDIHSILSQKIGLRDLAPVPVTTAVAGKTMVEKMFLLHELFSVEGQGMKAERKSRHLYDLYRMMNQPFAGETLRDDALWESIRHHREIYTSVSGMDYKPDVRERMVLVPRTDIMEDWRRDYENMCDAMIYGDKPTWEELMGAMEQLQMMVRKRRF